MVVSMVPTSPSPHNPCLLLTELTYGLGASWQAGLLVLRCPFSSGFASKRLKQCELDRQQTKMAEIKAPGWQEEDDKLV